MTAYLARGFKCPHCAKVTNATAVDDGKGRRVYVLTCVECGKTRAVEMAHGGGFEDKQGRVMEG